MKRFRILGIDFDARVHALVEAQDHWGDRVKQQHEINRYQTERGLALEFGEAGFDRKRQNFIDLGSKPFSILAFHNRFLEQVRVAFVMSAYYPSLTGACALGERILNHLVLSLREEFKTKPEYKHVYRKDSFDSWDLAIDTLESWGVLLPIPVTDFRRLRDYRNQAIHFRPEVDHNDRSLALESIRVLSSIISSQFGALGRQPWILTCGSGEIYIKKAWETDPFVRQIYLPNCRCLGPRHRVVSMRPWQIEDASDYEMHEISDDEFCALRNDHQAR